MNKQNKRRNVVAQSTPVSSSGGNEQINVCVVCNPNVDILATECLDNPAFTTKCESHKASADQLTSDAQTFNDRMSLIVRQLNAEPRTNQCTVNMENSFHIHTDTYIQANDLALIQSEFGAVDIWLDQCRMVISGEVTK